MSPFIALALLGLSQDPAATVLPDVMVEARDPLITVTVLGDVPVEVIVRSAPIGVRCGAGAFRYDRYEAPRLCWIRRPHEDVVRLTAEGLDKLGPGWAVDWDGCDPQPDPLTCDVSVPIAGANVTARFHRS